MTDMVLDKGGALLKVGDRVRCKYRVKGGACNREGRIINLAQHSLTIWLDGGGKHSAPPSHVRLIELAENQPEEKVGGPPTGAAALKNDGSSIFGDPSGPRKFRIGFALEVEASTQADAAAKAVRLLGDEAREALVSVVL